MADHLSEYDAALRDILNQRRYPAMGWEPDQADDASWWWRKADGDDFTYERMTDAELSAHTALTFDSRRIARPQGGAS